MWKWLKETILAVVVVVLTTAGAAAAAPSLSDGAHLLTPAERQYGPAPGHGPP